MGSKGIVERCVKTCESILTAPEAYQLTRYLAAMPLFPALRIPPAGLEKSAITATEMARMLPVALRMADNQEGMMPATSLISVRL